MSFFWRDSRYDRLFGGWLSEREQSKMVASDQQKFVLLYI